jgi:hypothetical protein
MEGKIYIVAAVENKKKSPSKIVLQPTAIVAKTDQDAAIKAVLGNKKLAGLDQDMLEVVVRPF